MICDPYRSERKRRADVTLDKLEQSEPGPGSRPTVEKRCAPPETSRPSIFVAGAPNEAASLVQRGQIRDVPPWALEEHAGAKLPEEIAASVAGQSQSSFAPLAPLLTIGETAALLHVAPRTIRRMIGRGEIAAVRIGGSIRIRPHDIRKVILGY